MFALKGWVMSLFFKAKYDQKSKKYEGPMVGALKTSTSREGVGVNKIRHMLQMMKI